MIYRAFSFMLLCLALVSCKDDFDIQKLQDHPRLVVYCFPTEGDTTLVSVAKSLPVASVKGNVDILSREKVDAHIIYKVNGANGETHRKRGRGSTLYPKHKIRCAFATGRSVLCGRQAESWRQNQYSGFCTGFLICFSIYLYPREGRSGVG